MFRTIVFTVLLSACLAFPAQRAQAQEDVSVTGQQEALTVTDVLVDKTDDNAVAARKAAILEAKRAAFERLARNILSPDKIKDYTLPEDAKISGFVRDFEIKDEKISSNRYKANFTVRFSPETAEFIEYGDTAFGGVFGSRPRTAVAQKVFGRERVVLLVPYFKKASGEKILWEDPNPWREEWQSLGGVMVSKNVSIMVPTGDLKDVSAGASAALWQEDYTVLDRLMRHYRADEALVTVAAADASGVTVEVYGYAEGRLEYKMPLTVAREDGGYGRAVSEIVADKSLFAEAAAAPVLPSKQYILEVTMFFDNPKEWLGARKRIVSVEPAPALNIVSLNRDSVKFHLKVDSEDNFYTLLRELDKKRLNLIPAQYQTSAVADPGVERRNYVLRLDY